MLRSVEILDCGMPSSQKDTENAETHPCPDHSLLPANAEFEEMLTDQSVLLLRSNTGQLKKKVTFSQVCNEVTSEPTITRYTTNVRKSRHFAARSPLAAAARNAFPRQLQTNFESFPNNCCISRDCRLTGYFIKNM
jgi:hypothetical protein